MEDIMNKKNKNTQELENILLGTHPRDFEKFYNENKKDMVDENQEFFSYVRELLAEKNIKQQEVFLRADISERYGYKILSGEKHTKQRDTILRICYAAEFTLEETQKALKKYGMPQLYAKIPREALLMAIFNKRVGTIIDVNEILKNNKQEVLRSSGTTG